MKILLMGNDESVHIKRWARWLGKNGHEVKVLNLFNLKPVYPQPEYYSVETIEYNPVLPKPLKYWVVYSKLENFIREYRPDIIHGFYAPSHGYFASHFGREKHPSICSLMGSDISIDGAEKNKRTKTALLEADYITVCNNQTKEKVKEITGRDNNIFVQHWGVDTKAFNRKADMLFRQRFFQGAGTLVLCTRSHNKNSNIPVLLDAIKLFFEEHPEKKENTFLIFAGDGKESKKYRGKAKELGIKSNTVFIGQKPEAFLPSLYASCDVFIDPFYTDNPGSGEGVGVLEAMASGLPIIATKRPGLNGVVVHGVNGYKYDHNDPRSLRRQLYAVLDPPNILKEDYSRNLAKEKYDEKKVMRSIEEFYKKIVSQKIPRTEPLSNVFVGKLVLAVFFLYLFFFILLLRWGFFR